MLAPPLLVSYSSVDDYLSALPNDLRQKYEDDVKSLVEKGLPPIVSSSCLAALFGYSVKFVNAMHKNNSKYYREFSIKKGHKTRKIQSPKVALKVIQKWFGHHLVRAITVSDNVFGFVPGRSAVDAASLHCGSAWVFSVDIENFFSSTPQTIVKKTLIELGYSQKAVNLIVPLCCYKDYLAQGSPASPVLSNLVLKQIDEKLLSIAKSHNVIYTRYVDDIVFSGSDEFPEAIKIELYKLFESTYWKLSKKKEHFANAKIGQRLKVHGLLVHGEKARLTKGYRNKIRAYKHMISAGKIKETDIQRIKGHINYANSIDKKSN